MKIAFLTTRIDKPSFRYRVAQYIPILEKEGFLTQVLIYPKNAISKPYFFRSLKSYDIIFLHRKLPNFIDRFFLKKLSKKIVFDFDDALMFRATGQKTFNSIKRQSLFKKTILSSSLVIAGNSYLKDLSTTCHSNIKIIPTPVDMERYQPKQMPPHQKKDIIIGWLGSKSTMLYLDQFIPVFEKLQTKYPDIKLKIISNGTIEPLKSAIIYKTWNYTEEISDIHSFDIGIMPLTDDPWSKGKCGFKLIQYMACNIPSICSPVGVNSEIIKDGINGFYASNEKEWFEKCEKLILSPTLRKELGEQGRKTINEKYSLHVNSKILIDVLRNVMH